MPDKKLLFVLLSRGGEVIYLSPAAGSAKK
jgi:hypothetical protein